jgi:KUP system potassium uptake protein
MAHSETVAEEPDEASQSPRSGLSTATALFLALGATGVVFGDIGTSPLYAFREALAHSAGDGISEAAIFGVLSLALWSLIIVVSLKYVMFLMRADNEGEGGVLALLALAGRAIGGRRGLVLWLGVVGAALFYGDAIITPALSVLSAVEGLRTIPGFGDAISEQTIITITLVILVALFAIQSRGTAAVSKLFGPICVVWFGAIGGLGLWHIADYPAILGAISPHHAVAFLASNGVVGLIVLGSVFLTVTGAEALTADMGHFGRLPIRLAWFALVFPALVLNYIGQGAFAMAALREAQAAGQALQTQDWFFLMAPAALRVGLIVLAGLATIIASQAVITGAFSLTQQAVQLGLLPRVKVVQTSPGSMGQIYLPAINWLLLLGVWLLVVQFRSSSAMASAYGIAVTGTMVVTTTLAFVIVRKLWGWNLPKALAVIVPLLAIDLIFFGANILRVVDGGWVPLAVGALICLIIWTWLRGRTTVAAIESDGAVPLADFAAALARREPQRVAGTAIYLTARNDLTPRALLHNLKHNQVLHQHNFVTTVRVLNRPTVDPTERITINRIDANFARIELRYGYTEQPSVRDDLIAAAAAVPGAGQASYFIGRNNFAQARDHALPRWQEILFIALHRNASDPTDYFGLPPNRVIELGSQHTI